MSVLTRNMTQLIAAVALDLARDIKWAAHYGFAPTGRVVCRPDGFKEVWRYVGVKA